MFRHTERKGAAMLRPAQLRVPAIVLQQHLLVQRRIVLNELQQLSGIVLSSDGDSLLEAELRCEASNRKISNGVCFETEKPQARHPGLPRKRLLRR
jgi:hypothetical protein